MLYYIILSHLIISSTLTVANLGSVFSLVLIYSAQYHNKLYIYIYTYTYIYIYYPAKANNPCIIDIVLTIYLVLNTSLHSMGVCMSQQCCACRQDEVCNKDTAHTHKVLQVSERANERFGFIFFEIFTESRP